MRVLSLPLSGVQQTLQCLTTMAARRNFCVQLQRSAETRRCQRFLSGTPFARYYVSNRLEMYNLKLNWIGNTTTRVLINVTEGSPPSVAAEPDRGLARQMVKLLVLV